MGNQQKRGPIGRVPVRAGMIDSGTRNRTRTPSPGPSGTCSRVSAMSLDDRFIIVLKRTANYLPGDAREEFLQLISQTNLVIMAATLAVWAASHYFGVGFVVDLILFVAGLVFLGLQVFQAANDFVTALKLTKTARSQADLDAAARHMARFVAVVGVAGFTAIVFKGAKRAGKYVRTTAAGELLAARLSGMTKTHMEVFRQTAKETEMIIAVRDTNRRSTQWIERGFPAKPKSISAHTDSVQGIVKAMSMDEIAQARIAKFYVVDADMIPRNSKGEVLKWQGVPEWKVEPGQIIDPLKKKPLVGDYDLLGVIDPTAKRRNLVLATKNGKPVDDFTNPKTNMVVQELNNKLDQPRVMHGSHDGFDALPNKGGATIYFPDGRVVYLENPRDVAAFYKSIGRESLDLKKKLGLAK